MKKFNQRSFTLFAINYIVGFGFITTFTSLVKIGIFGLVIFSININCYFINKFSFC